MERSGIDMLEEIIKRLERLEQRLNVLDQNVKTIVNTTKIADMVTKAIDSPLEGFARAIPQSTNVKDQIAAKKKKIEEGFSNFKFESVDGSKTNKVNPGRRLPATKNIMVKGKMLANDGGKTVSLAGVSVKVYDAKDKLVKETKTNRAGYWMSQLPPGKYVALFEGELNGKKLVPQNRNFEVPLKLPEGQTELEVV